MLLITFTYHNVMPEFLDFLSSFGRQTYSQDFQTSGFRQRSCFRSQGKGTQISELGRSGCAIRLCYSLRSVEPSESQQDWPWSIRQTAVHHSFDLETGRANWFVIKGNEMMKKRFREAKSRGLQVFNSFSDLGKAFASSLTDHLTVCEWSNEHWRWYITFLEDRLQTLTRRALSIKVEKSVSPVVWDSVRPNIQQRLSEADEDKGAAMERRFTQLSSPSSPKTPREEIQVQPFPPDKRGLPAPNSTETCASSSHEFSFTDVQKTQYIQEQARDALLAVKVNTTVLMDLREHYQVLAESNQLPQHTFASIGPNVTTFKQDLSAIGKDFQMHQLRLESLLNSVAERKGLVCGALNIPYLPQLNLYSCIAYWSTTIWRRIGFLLQTRVQ